MTEHYSLAWSSHLAEIKSSLIRLHNLGQMHDVTIAADGNHINAHKIVLAICSEYFRDLFSANPTSHQHAIIFLKDISHNDLKNLVQFIYTGEVAVPENELNSFMSAAKSLKIKGLMGNIKEDAITRSTIPNGIILEPSARYSPVDQKDSQVVEIQPPSAVSGKRRPGPLRPRQRPYPRPIQVKQEPITDEADSSTNHSNDVDVGEESSFIEPEITIKEDFDSVEFDEVTGQLQVLDNNAISNGPGLKYIRTPKGKQHLVQSDHIYWRQATSPGKTFWKCSMYHKTGCRGRCVTDNKAVLQKSSLHNHAPLTDKVIQSELEGHVFYM